MGKINNTTLYPLQTAADITSGFLIPLSKGAGGETVLTTVAVFTALLGSMKSIKVTLTAATQYQNNDFLDKAFVFGFLSGQEISTGNLISTFDPDTGIIVFNTEFGAITGTVIFVTQA
jgi:hypothetical protein